jgi:hypothetical protein
LQQGYLLVPLAAEKRYLTAFVTHDGVFQYCRLPFGLCFAPSAFQQMMVAILAGLKGVTVFVDDIVVHAPTEEDHHRRLAKAFRRLAQHRLTINSKKCLFAVSEVEFLGYSVSAEGVRPLRSPVESIQNIPSPGTPSELASLLGMTNCYLRFVEGYASITEPLRRL